MKTINYLLILLFVINQARKDNIKFDKYQFQNFFDKEMEEFKNPEKVDSN